jgi:hypothetical protein
MNEEYRLHRILSRQFVNKLKRLIQLHRVIFKDEFYESFDYNFNDKNGNYHVEFLIQKCGNYTDFN